MVERLHRTLTDSIAQFVRRDGKDWDTWVPFALMAYRAIPHSSTGFSPNYLLFGRELRTPIDFGPDIGMDCITERDQASLLRDKLAEAHEQASRRAEQMWADRTRYCNSRRRERELEEGEWVYLRVPAVKPGHCAKFHCPWTGPHQVIKKLSKVTYEICKATGERVVVHLNRLKKAFVENEPFEKKRGMETNGSNHLPEREKESWEGEEEEEEEWNIQGWWIPQEDSEGGQEGEGLGVSPVREGVSQPSTGPAGEHLEVGAELDLSGRSIEDNTRRSRGETLLTSSGHRDSSCPIRRQAASRCPLPACPTVPPETSVLRKHFHGVLERLRKGSPSVGELGASPPREETKGTSPPSEIVENIEDELEDSTLTPESWDDSGEITIRAPEEQTEESSNANEQDEGPRSNQNRDPDWAPPGPSRNVVTRSPYNLRRRVDRDVPDTGDNGGTVGRVVAGRWKSPGRGTRRSKIL